MTAKQTQAATTNQQSQGAQSSQQGQTPKGGRSDERQARSENRLARREAPLLMSPFVLLQRFFSDNLTSFFDDLTGRGASSAAPRAGDGGAIAWMPRIDVLQRGNEFVVRADLPGMNPDDISVEISDDAITISGQRQQEHVEENGSVYRFERTYGSFFREIPLPQGAIADQAKASFKDGVLEITVPAPPEQVSRGRRLEIDRGEGTKTTNKNEGQ